MSENYTCFPSMKTSGLNVSANMCNFSQAHCVRLQPLLEKWNVGVYKLEALSFHITLVHVGFWTSVGWRLGDVLLYPKYFVCIVILLCYSIKSKRGKQAPFKNWARCQYRKHKLTKSQNAADFVWSSTEGGTRLNLSVGLGYICHLTQGAHFQMNANISLLLLHFSICSMSVCFRLFPPQVTNRINAALKFYL